MASLPDRPAKATVQLARPEDIPGWLELAGEVEYLFGPMVEEPGFLAALEKNIVRESAFCVRADDGPPGAPLLAGILFSPRPPEYRIGWLAVAERARGRGLGRRLVAYALALVQPPAEVSVVTFGPGSQEGEPARRLYEAFGFQPAELTEPGPDGARRQVFRLRIGWQSG